MGWGRRRTRGGGIPSLLAAPSTPRPSPPPHAPAHARRCSLSSRGGQAPKCRGAWGRGKGARAANVLGPTTPPPLPPFPTPSPPTRRTRLLMCRHVQSGEGGRARAWQHAAARAQTEPWSRLAREGGGLHSPPTFPSPRRPLHALLRASTRALGGSSGEGRRPSARETPPHANRFAAIPRFLSRPPLTWRAAMAAAARARRPTEKSMAWSVGGGVDLGAGGGGWGRMCEAWTRRPPPARRPAPTLPQRPPSSVRAHLGRSLRRKVWAAKERKKGGNCEDPVFSVRMFFFVRGVWRPRTRIAPSFLGNVALDEMTASP